MPYLTSEQAIESFWRRIQILSEDECWIWQGTDSGATGYGRFWLWGTLVYAHRFAYMLTHGIIPRDRQIHHLCETRKCVNPAHLILQDIRIHGKLHASTNPLVAQRTRQRSHCKHGHKYTPENTGMTKEGWRVCRACMRLHARRRYYRIRGRQIPS